MENSIEKITTKVEEFINNQIEKFEKNPMSSAVRILIVYLVIKFIWNKVK